MWQMMFRSFIGIEDETRIEFDNDYIIDQNIVIVILGVQTLTKVPGSIYLNDSELSTDMV